MITLNDDRLKQFESDLKHFAIRAYPFATRSTVNSAAFKGREFAQDNIKKQMINRNAFTRRSVLVNRATTLAVSRQFATVGSTLDYMEVQEFGGTTDEPMIPTSVAAGQSRGKSPRTRPVRRPNRKGTARWSRQRSKAPLVVQIREAKAKKQEFVFLKMRRTEGVFRIAGDKLQMIYRTDIKSRTIPANPWLFPVVAQVTSLIPRMYQRELLRQLKRQRLFGNL